MKRLTVLLLALVLLCGCKKNDQPFVTTVETTEAETTVEETTEAETTVEETTEAPVLYRHPLTGQPLEEPVMARPYAVVINNIYDAQPLHGVGQADVLYEITAEGGGGITRMVAVFSDISQVEKIGSIRSSRTYLIDISKAYDAVFVHTGGSEYAYSKLKKENIDNLDGIYASSAYFYRDKDRLNSGYALEHTLFSSGDRIIALAEQKGYTLQYEEPLDFGLSFDEEAAIKGETAQKIESHYFSAGGKGSIFQYDSENGTYTMVQRFYGSYDRDLKDGNDEKLLEFKNLFFLYSVTTSDGYRMFAELTGEGTGYYALDGKIVPIKWSRETEEEPFVYTLEDGTPLTLGVGKTYVGILPTGSPVEFE